MGSWGTGIWESDAALDVRDDFNDYVAKGISEPDALEKVYKHLDTLHGQEVLAFYDLCRMSDVDQLAYFQLAEKMLEEELSEDALNCWVDPDERKESLLEWKEDVLSKSEYSTFKRNQENLMNIFS